MANVFEMFSQSLNDAVALLVTEAMSSHATQLIALQTRLNEQEQLIAELTLTSKEFNIEQAVEKAVEKAVEDAVEKAVEDAVEEAVDIDSMFGGREFADAVKEVIADALR